MKKFITAAGFALFLTMFAVESHADLLTGLTTPPWESYFRFLNDPGDSEWHYSRPFGVQNLTTGQLLNMFCADRDTQTSDNFSNPDIGEEYWSEPLNSVTMTLFSDLQKAALNSLFSHVYTTIVDASNNLLIGLPAGMAFQLAVWEIVHETNGAWDITSGSFGISAAATFYPDHSSSYFDDDLYNEVVALLDFWFAAIANESLWGPDYPWTNVELTVYVATNGVDASQTLISPTFPPAAIPEPTTMLMFGVATLALPFARRLRKI